MRGGARRRRDRRFRAPTRVALATALLCLSGGLWSDRIPAAEQMQWDATFGARRAIGRARAHEHGEGVAKNQAIALELYCVAARDGNPEGQFALGWMYFNGRGVQRDDDAAGTLFSLAARQGHEHAARLLELVPPFEERKPACLTAPMPQAPTAAFMPAAPPVPEPREDAREDGAFAALPPEKRKLADLVRNLARAYGVHPQLALAVVATESNFDPNAVSPKDARGLMQLIPGTARRFDVKDPFDPHENVRGGLAYLRWLLAYYRGRVALATAAYNAGEAAVDKHGGVPPFPETQGYVQSIRRWFSAEHHPYDPKLTAPSPMVVESGEVRM